MPDAMTSKIYLGVQAPRPASTRTLPSAALMVLIQASCEPGIIDGQAITSTSCPGFRESFVIPSAIMLVTEASSPTHCLVSPFAPFTFQIRVTCGFLHMYCSTVPRVVAASREYCAALWCANSAAPSINTAVATAVDLMTRWDFLFFFTW